MFPKLTNIDSKIKEKILSYSVANEASKLTPWIRVFSGAKRGNLNGLILQSNTDFKLIRATGESSFSIYGDSQSSGIMGKTWDGKIVESNSSRFLKPSPIITGFEVSEGQDQISRNGTLNITAFTLEQMELIQTYFLEPGYSLFVEWGWNTEDGYMGFTNTNQSNSSPDELVKTIAKKSLNYKNLIDTRLKSKGEYDGFLGFIVGGNVTSTGDSFNISVKLKGEPSLPAYLQTYRNSKKLSENGNSVVSTNKTTAKYSIQELTEEAPTNSNYLNLFSGDAIVESAEQSVQEQIAAKRRFRNMFNELPADKQLEKVKKLEDSVSFKQFINFDKLIERSIANISQTEDLVVEVGEESVEVQKENLFSKNKYIRMDLLVEILNTLGEDDKFIVGGEEISFKIDINNTYIGAFPYMFSTNPNKLIIPGIVPDFFAYFLESDTITQLQNGNLISDSTFYPHNADPSLDRFVQPFGLTKDGYRETARYWGLLSKLFVNYDVFTSKLNKKILNIREVYTEILNEISSAVNAFWKFQIVETEDPKTNKIVIGVIDEHFVGQIPKELFDKITEFQHSGVGSIFKTANLDISLPSSMVGQIVSNRLGSAVNPDSQIIKTGNFFTSDLDLFMSIRGEVDGSTPDVNDDRSELELVREELSKYLVDGNKRAQSVTNRETGELVATQDAGVGFRDLPIIIPFNGNEEGKRYKTLVEKEFELAKRDNEQKVANVTAYLNQIDIVPRPGVTNTIIFNNFVNNRTTESQKLDRKSRYKKVNSIFCFEDSDFFDLLKNNFMRNKYPSTDEKGLSTLIPIKYEFTILGNSGIKRGDMFKVNGIPQKYSKHGIFQVTEVSQTLTTSGWETTIGGLYRQIQ